MEDMEELSPPHCIDLTSDIKLTTRFLEIPQYLTMFEVEDRKQSNCPTRVVIDDPGSPDIVDCFHRARMEHFDSMEPCSDHLETE